MPDHRPSSHLGLYRSAITGSQHRRSITVGRDSMVQDTIEILRKGIGKRPKHHILFIGPRGIGKTHLLSLIEDDVKNDVSLKNAYHVVRFAEESNRVLSFGDFLLGVCQILADTLPEEPQWATLYQQLSTEERDEIIVDTLVPAIRKRRRERQQSLIIMLENLNQVFEQQLKDSRHIAALRGFLMEDNGCLLIATSPLHFGSISDHQEPFYDFFDVQVLDQLTEEQTIDLIRKNLEWERREDLLRGFDNLRPKLLALYRMTGGSPRLNLMLYELIAHESVSEVKVQFEILLDRITPFYQDRMRDLGPQERALLETIASMRDQPKTPTAISANMRMKPSQVSSLLNRLSKSQYLKSIENPDDKRSRLYTIREGFFDIWLAMNVTRGARQRLPFLVEFFAQFYPSIEARNKKREEYRLRLANGEFDVRKTPLARSDLQDGLDYLSEVGTEDERAAEKLRLAGLHVREGNAGQAESYLSEVRTLPLDDMGKWIVGRVDSENDLDYLAEVEELINCWGSYRSGDLESFADRVKSVGGALSFKSWTEMKISFLRDHLELLPEPSDRVETRLRLGNILMPLARWSEAESQLRAAVDEATTLEDNQLLSQAMTNLAQLLKSTNRILEAEPLMHGVLVINEQLYGTEHPTVATALNNLAVLYMDTNRLELSEHLVRRALKIDEQSGTENLSALARDLNNLAQIMKITNRLSEAESLMRRSLAIHENTLEVDHPFIAIALNNLSSLLMNNDRFAEAEPLLRRALAINEQVYGDGHPDFAIHLNNLAQLLLAKSRFSEAEAMMRTVLTINEQSFSTTHPSVAKALNNLASLLVEANRLEEAEPLIRRVLTICEQSAGTEHPDFATYLNNLAELLHDRGKLEEAESLARRALDIDERYCGGAHPSVARDLSRLGSLLKVTNRTKEAEALFRRALDINVRSNGSDHVLVAIRHWNLALLLRQLDQLDEAIQHIDGAVEIYQKFKKSNGFEHPHWSNVRQHQRAMRATAGLPDIDDRESS